MTLRARWLLLALLVSLLGCESSGAPIAICPAPSSRIADPSALACDAPTSVDPSEVSDLTQFRAAASALVCDWSLRCDTGFWFLGQSFCHPGFAALYSRRPNPRRDGRERESAPAVAQEAPGNPRPRHPGLARRRSIASCSVAISTRRVVPWHRGQVRMSTANPRWSSHGQGWREEDGAGGASGLGSESKRNTSCGSGSGFGAAPDRLLPPRPRWSLRPGDRRPPPPPRPLARHLRRVRRSERRGLDRPGIVSSP